MAPIWSKYLTKNNVILSATLTASTLWFLSQKYSKRIRRNKKKPTEEVNYLITEVKRPIKRKAHLDLQFFRQLFKLIKIVIPGWTSPEAGYAALVAVILVARTLCDLFVLHATAGIESVLILGNKEEFVRKSISYFSVVPIIAIVNNILKFATGELKIKMRQRLSLHLYDDYLNKLTYYRLSNLDSRIPNVDQLLTTDVDKFCNGLTELYSNISKPILDVCIFSYKMTTKVSLIPPIMVFAYLLASGIVLTALRRPTVGFTVQEQKLEGEYRHVNARIITYSEEIAFYNGNIREQKTIFASFNKLISHVRRFLHFRTLIGFFDNIVAKYLATVIGWSSFSIPFFVGSYGMDKLQIAERSKLYHEYGNMLYKLAQAVGRLVLSGRELTRLAGFTVRITQLQQVLADINDDRYERSMVEGSAELTTNKGQLIFQDNIIKFKGVPLITPNGDVLIQELNMEIRSGMNVLVCGPNGAGKSSIFRILGELWPIFGGELTKPPSGKLFYVPQKPYMTLGSLRDQITYPHSAREAKNRGCTDQQLTQYLRLVHLEYLLERQDELDAVADWLDILSGGEKQRIAMARLFYHSPQFAILDECTSSVAVDVEDIMYSYCKTVGITLLTVTHRKSLWKHHEFVLYLDGRGGYTFNPIDAEMEQFGS